MPLISYAEARPFAKAIAREVEARRMPPWHADPKYGEWANDRRLDEKELATILAWARGGAAEGDPAEMPAPVKFAAGWTMGEPDKVIYASNKEFELGTEVEDLYKIFIADPKLGEDLWVEGIEVRPGNPAVVHHIIVTAIDREKGFAGAIEGGDGWLGAMAPGRPPDVFPAGQARLIKAGSRIIFQVHYHKEKGATANDRTVLGLRLAKGPIEKAVNNQALTPKNIFIPAGAADHEIIVERKFAQDVHLLSLMPHMHFRGKAMRVVAKYAGGTEETLLDVPHYDFNWQTTYVFKTPKAIPSGTVVRVEARYDNSDGNKFNPDPKVDVRYGQKTTDEMMVAFADYTLDAEDLRAGKAVEALVTETVFESTGGN